MNQDLRHSLRSLAGLGENGATPADAATHRALGRVGAARRRRPVLVAGLTGVGVLTAGAAAALGYTFLQDDDAAAPFPDRLTPETTMPSYAPVSITCGAGVGDLVTTDEPLALGSTSTDTANGTPVTLAAETGTGLETYLRSTSAQPVTITTTQETATFLVKDGHVVAVPASPLEPTALPADVTLAPDGTQTLPDDGMVPCPDSSGVAPASIPAGDYDAYGVATVSIEGTRDTTEVIGGAWPVRVGGPLEQPPVPVTLPAANPDAVFPECGAVVDAPTGTSPVLLRTGPGPLLERTWQPPLPLGPQLEIARAQGDVVGAEGQMGSVYLVAVKDGVVVGGYAAEPSEVPFSITSDGPGYSTSTATVVTSLCSDPTTPLPEGRYSMWAAQDFTITSGFFWEGESTVQVGDAIEHRALHQVATLWIDGSGQSAPAPGLSPGWPTPLSLAEASGAGTPASVVWLATTTEHVDVGDDASLIPARDALADLGYPETDIPLACQSGLGALGIEVPAESWNGYGIGVVLATEEEAQAFVDLWEPLHGPVLGVVTNPVECAG